MKKLIEYILTKLVDNPDSVKVETTETDEVINVEITVDKSDLGKIIGKEGRTINAIRTVAKTLAVKEKKRLNLQLRD